MLLSHPALPPPLLFSSFAVAGCGPAPSNLLAVNQPTRPRPSPSPLFLISSPYFSPSPSTSLHRHRFSVPPVSELPLILPECVSTRCACWFALENKDRSFCLSSSDLSCSLQLQAASSNSLDSSNQNPPAIKQETSLIDFDADIQTPVTAAISQPLQSSDLTTGAIWSFDNAPHIKAPQPPPNSNPLDSVLTQLSLPDPAPEFPTSNGSSVAASSTTASTPSTAVDSLFSPAVLVSLTPLTGAVNVASNASFLLPDGVYSSGPGDILTSSQW